MDDSADTKRRLEKFFSICTCTKHNSPNNSYPSFIGSIIFSLAFGLQNVDMSADGLFSTCRSKSFQLRGVRDLWGFFHESRPCFSISVSLAGLYVLFCVPFHLKKTRIMVTGMLCSCMCFGAFFNTCNQVAKPNDKVCHLISWLTLLFLEGLLGSQCSAWSYIIYFCCQLLLRMNHFSKS